MSEPPAISVVIPAFQAQATIAQCVRALECQTLPREDYEIIVVDDASTDATALEADRAGASVVRLPCNLGPGAARNAGIALSRGQLIVFTDADCEPLPNFVELLARPLNDPAVSGSKGVYASRQRARVAEFVQLEYEERYRHTAQQRSLDFVDTYACCFRRADLLRAGGFDARLRMCEDQEMSFRFEKSGLRMVFVNDARTYHRHSESVRKYLLKKFHIARWKTRVLQRHPRKLLHDSHTPGLMKLEIVLAWAMALTGVAYLMTLVAFVLRAARRDFAVALTAPLLLFARDIALGAGLCVGIIESMWTEICGS
jgi:glycosyltransferase involved in cell wall biosynthesis